METIELTVTVQNMDVYATRRDNGAHENGKVQVDPLWIKAVDIFADWLRQGKISKRAELEVLGMLMYEALFGGKIGSFFEEALREVPHGQRLRIQLSFGEGAGRLRDWPWEYLYYPESETSPGFFFSTYVNLILSRYRQLKGGAYSAKKTKEGSLRLLFAVSKPEKLGPVAEQPIIEAIQKLAERQPIHVDILSDPTVDNFLEIMQEKKPHVLHFIGHGRYDRKKEEAEIAFLQPNLADARWVSGKAFAEYFQQIDVTPRVVFLHLCEPAPADNSEANFVASFVALGPQLMGVQIQAVVAMQYPIPNDAALTFSRAFYEELAKGRQIDYAVQIGRWRLVAASPEAYDNRVFGTPVLYLQSCESIVLPTEAAPPVTPVR